MALTIIEALWQVLSKEDDVRLDQAAVLQWQIPTSHACCADYPFKDADAEVSISTDVKLGAGTGGHRRRAACACTPHLHLLQRQTSSANTACAHGIVGKDEQPFQSRPIGRFATPCNRPKAVATPKLAKPVQAQQPPSMGRVQKACRPPLDPFAMLPPLGHLFDVLHVMLQAACDAVRRVKVAMGRDDLAAGQARLMLQGVNVLCVCRQKQTSAQTDMIRTVLSSTANDQG